MKAIKRWMSDVEQNPTEHEVSSSEVQPEATPVVGAPPVSSAPVSDGTDIDESELPTDMELPGSDAVGTDPQPGRFQRLVAVITTHKKFSIPLIALALLALLLAVPVTRYPLLGTFLKQQYKVVVLDDRTTKPVSNVSLTFGGQTVKTDNTGHATLRCKVGTTTFSAEKKYYQTATGQVLVPILRPKIDFRILLKATGRQVPVTVVNHFNHQPVVNALVRAVDTEARTDSKGEAILVLPANDASVTATISASGYNDTNASLTVTEQVTDKNSFQLTPAGKLYFLSKLSGKIDVVKTDLDGANRQIVLAGTGNEVDNDTVLLASRDWKYLAFKSKRDNGLAKLYLIDTSTDKLTTIDEGNASFTPVGWYGSHFVYLLYRNGVQLWQSNAQALKTFDATNGKLAVIDQTVGEGTGQYDDAYTTFSTVYILENELVYAQNWFASGGNHLSGKSVSLISAQPDGGGKKSIKDFAIPSGVQYNYFIGLAPYEPQALYIQVPSGTGSNSYQTYEGGKLAAAADMNDQKYYNQPYPTYLLSPSGKHTFWSEQRDGKNSLFVGDPNASSPQQIAALSDYTPYGWYSDDYLLVSKNSSELYVMPVSGGAVFKVTDYHKPALDFRGYGYGYGGF